MVYIVVVAIYFDDAVKSLLLDIALYQKLILYLLGKKDPEFVKKPDLAMSLVDQYFFRGNRP